MAASPGERVVLVTEAGELRATLSEICPRGSCVRLVFSDLMPPDPDAWYPVTDVRIDDQVDLLDVLGGTPCDD